MKVARFENQYLCPAGLRNPILFESHFVFVCLVWYLNHGISRRLKRTFLFPKSGYGRVVELRE